MELAVKITELLGRMPVPNTEAECWYDFDKKCVKLKFTKWDDTSACKYGVIIEIDPEDIPLVPEAQAYRNWVTLKATKKTQMELFSKEK